MAPVRLCACAALAAITLTACGGTSASPAAPTAASPTSVPPSTRADAPGEISSKALARVYRATVRAGSYRLAVRTSQPTAAGIVTGTLTGRSTTTTPRASVMSAVYLLANVVYQGHARNLDVAKLWEIGNYITRGVLPDLTFLLDMPASAAHN